jgi:hypothetical protein
MMHTAAYNTDIAGNGPVKDRPADRAVLCHSGSWLVRSVDCCVDDSRLTRLTVSRRGPACVPLSWKRPGRPEFCR